MAVVILISQEIRGFGMEFLTLKNIRLMKDEIRPSFHELLQSPITAKKKNAHQWKFLAALFELTVEGLPPEVEYSHLKLIQYKYEIQGKLKRYYMKEGPAVDFVFVVMNERELKREYLLQDADYPRIGGFYLMIRDNRKNPANEIALRIEEEDYIKKVVVSCIDAEFAAFASLPEINLAALHKWFQKDGPALQVVMDILNKSKEKGRILSNTGNPSFKIIRDVRIKEYSNEQAIVSTHEHWFLRWWGIRENKYVYTYRESNPQTYILNKMGGEWLVYADIRPNPRSSVFMRVLPKRPKPKF